MPPSGCSWFPGDRAGLLEAAGRYSTDCAAISRPAEAAFRSRKGRYGANVPYLAATGILLNWRSGGAAPTLCAASRLE